MRRRFGPYEEVNVAIAALVLGGPESVRARCVFHSVSQRYCVWHEYPRPRRDDVHFVYGAPGRAGGAAEMDASAE